MHINIRNKGLIFIVAFALATISAILTITGMTAVFKGAITMTVAAFIILEITKLTVAGWLIIGRQSFLKLPLVIIMLALMVISLWGHYGFWIEAYVQDTAIQEVVEDRSTLLDRQIVRYETELNDIQSRISKMPDNFVTKREEAYRESAPRRLELNTILDSLYIAKNSTTRESVQAELKIGPFKHFGAWMGLSQDGVARLISLWIAIIMDPAAVLMIMVAVQDDTKSSSSQRKRARRKIRLWTRKRSKSEVPIKRPINGSNGSDAAPVQPVEVIGNLTPAEYTSKTVVHITGRPQEAVYKLAPILRIPNVIINLSPSNRHIEDLCGLLPNVLSVQFDSNPEADIILDDRPSYDQWLVDYYTKQVGVKPFTKSEWFGLLSGVIDRFDKAKHGVYLNLEDSSLENSIKSSLSARDSSLECLCESSIDNRTSGLLDSVRRSLFYQQRVVTLGSVSAIFELFGLDHKVYQGGISDKIANAYRLPGSTLIPASEDSLLGAINYA